TWGRPRGEPGPVPSPEASRARGPPPRARAPHLSRVHGGPGLPPAETPRLGELVGYRGPAGQRRIGHVSRLVEGLRRSGPRRPHRARVPGEPDASERRGAGPASAGPAGNRDRRDLPADAAGSPGGPVH